MGWVRRSVTGTVRWCGRPTGWGWVPPWAWAVGAAVVESQGQPDVEPVSKAGLVRMLVAALAGQARAMAAPVMTVVAMAVMRARGRMVGSLGDEPVVGTKSDGRLNVKVS